LRATREIVTGEEIFISYSDILEPAMLRQENLSYWKFTCTCQSCTGDTLATDERRRNVMKSAQDISSVFKIWHLDMSLPDSHVVDSSLGWISVIKEEGLEASDAYRLHLHAVMDAFVALGDAANAARFGRLLGQCLLAHRGKDDLSVNIGNPTYFQTLPHWRSRTSRDFTRRMLFERDQS